MRQLRLVTRVEYRYPYVPAFDRSGEPVLIPGHRLYAQLGFFPPDRDHDERLDDPDREFEAVVDTGCTIPILPRRIWEPFEGELRWLNRPATLTATQQSVAVAGGVYRYRLTQVRLAAFDLDGRWMPPAWGVAQCLDDPAARLPALLGLRTPLLERRRLRHSGNIPADQPVWWLEDDTP